MYVTPCYRCIWVKHEGGVAGTIDYLIFTRLFSRPGWLIKLILTVLSNVDIIK